MFTSSQFLQVRREGPVAFNLPTRGLALQHGVDATEQLHLGERVLVFWRWPCDAASLGAYRLLIARPSFESRQSRAAAKATFLLLSLEGDGLLEAAAFCGERVGSEAA